MSTLTAESDGRATVVTRQWGQRNRGLMTRIVTVIALLLIGSLFVIPFLWMLVTSLKAQQDVFNPSWIPSPIRWENYRE